VNWFALFVGLQYGAYVYASLVGLTGHGENQIDEMHELRQCMCVEIRLRHEPVRGRLYVL
jgi:hypothetical protein